MKNILLFLTSEPEHGGAYQYWLAVINSLSKIDRTRIFLEIIAFHDGWKEIAKSNGIECTIYHGKKNVFRRLFSKRLPFYMRGIVMIYTPFVLGYKKMKGEHVDLCLANYMVPALSWLKIPVGVPIFDLMHRYEKRFKEVSRDYCIREILYKYECKRAKIIFADSKVGKQQIIESYGKISRSLDKRIKVLPFVPPDYIYDLKGADDVTLMSNSSNEFKQAIFEKYFFYPAQFWSHKNHRNLIKAMAYLRRSGMLINLILVGSEKNSLNDIMALVNKYSLDNNIRILGYVSNAEMVFLYRHARALVMPSFFGPTNIPPLEAFELSCPVAVSNTYAMPEQCGDAALYFSPGSYKEIADCLKRLWMDDDLCRELIKNGKKKAAVWNIEKFGMRLRQEVLESM